MLYGVFHVWDFKTLNPRNRVEQQFLEPGDAREGAVGRCWSKGTNFQFKINKL